MIFLKKAWPFVVAAIVVSIGAFVLGRANKPPSVVTIYKEVTPVPKANRSQSPTAEVSGHVHTLPESTSETGHRGELRGPGSESVSSDAEGDANDSLVAEETASRVTKGGVPPELSREAMEQLDERARLQQQRDEIRKALQTFSGRDLSNEEFLHVLDLRKEYQSVQQKLGVFEAEGVDTSAGLDYFRFMATHSQKDGRIPTSKAPQFLELFEKVGKNLSEQQSIEHQAMLEQFGKIAHQAIENGDEYFQPRYESNNQ